MTDQPTDPDAAPTPPEAAPSDAEGVPKDAVEPPSDAEPGRLADDEPSQRVEVLPAPSEPAPLAAEALPSSPVWNPLPARALPVFVAGELPFAIFLMILCGGPTLVLAFVASSSLGMALGMGFLGALLGLVSGLWLAVRRFHRTFWRLDASGLSVREGRLWQREIRVPATRVQHLDLTRGPLQRGRQLATLVVHTAGSRHEAVTVPDLDERDAEHLRDALGRQLDRDLDD